MPIGDAQSMITAALRPGDMMSRKMAELVWDGLPPETKTALGNTLDNFLDDTSGFISPAAQKQIRQQNARRWD
jgi:hypothetical protein